MNPKVDLFLSKAKNWQAEMEQLRSIVLACQLTEELKWKQPCYTFQGNNILIIGAFKDYSALLFFKGSLLQASTAYVIPEELQKKLAIDPVFKTAFGSLTPGRQRAYNLHFSGAKQSATRESRIEKYRQQILDGKGINDCTCGLSKRMPTCDGSHKYL